MNKKLLQTALLGLFSLFTPFIAMAGLTNADVIKMVNAGLSSDIIVTTIKSTPDNKFDTGVDGLIALKEAKVPEEIIKIIVSGVSEAPKPKKALTNEELLSGEGSEASYGQIYLLEGKDEVLLTYQTPDMRAAVRGMGFGGVANYEVFKGAKAEKRLKDKKPSFLLPVPKGAQPKGTFTLALLAVRKNNVREIQTMGGGGGFMGTSSVKGGVPEERRIAVNVEKYSDQSHAYSGYEIYLVTPESSLKSGEYAIELGAHWFDFGVD